MKRNINSNNPKLREILPIFFWHRCIKCNKEFRREEGWEFRINVKHHVSDRGIRWIPNENTGGVTEIANACQKCLPYREAALNFFCGFF